MGVQVSNWDAETKKSTTTVEHIGLVVGTGSTYIGDGDSHYWAVVYDTESGTFKDVGLGYTPYGAKIDAPLDLQKVYDDLKAAKAALASAESALSAYSRAEQNEAWEAETVRKGKWVKVVKGRKVPKGTVGEVLWEGKGQWGRRTKMGLLDGTEVWTATDNVEVLIGATVVPSLAMQMKALGYDGLAEMAQEAGV